MFVDVDCWLLVVACCLFVVLFGVGRLFFVVCCVL